MFVKQNGDLTRELLATWQTQMSQGYGCTALNVHMYDQLLEMEQESISWQNENHTI